MTRAISRPAISHPPPGRDQGTGRELFAFMRQGSDGAEQGASAMLAAAGFEFHTIRRTVMSSASEAMTDQLT